MFDSKLCRKQLHILGPNNAFLGKVTRCLKCHNDWVGKNQASIKASAAKYRESEKYQKRVKTAEGRAVLALRENKYRKKAKLEALSHYGKNGQCQCRWSGCGIVDLDILTLDHVNNDGATARRNGQPRGKSLYTWIKKNNFPSGFQTLCWNHQWKKRILYLRRKQQREIEQILKPK